MRFSDKANSKRPLSASSEMGTFMLFFAAAILPLMVFMMVLSLDVAVYFKAEQKLQEAADDAALLAWRYLPYKSMAITAVKDLIRQRGLSGSLTYAGITRSSSSESYNDEFEVVLEQQIKPIFGAFFSDSILFQIRSVARSRSTPLDIFIAVDRSRYVAPDYINEVWGVSPDNSEYFLYSAPFNPFRDQKTATLVKRESAAAFMTQLCFNPYFSQLKKIAFNLYEYLAGAGRNGVGMGVFPGIELESLFSLRPLLRAAQQVQPELADSGEARALQKSASGFAQDSYYYDGIQLGASSWCSAAAANDLRFSAPTPFTLGDSSLITKLWKPVASVYSPPVTLGSDSDVFFNPAYQPFLTLRESLWSAVAKNSLPDSAAVIDAVIAQLGHGPDSETFENKSIRGGLTGTSTKTALILAGDVPHYKGIRFGNDGDPTAMRLSASISSIRKIVTENSDLRVKIIYIIVDDPSRPDSDSLNGIEERSDKLELFFQQQQQLQDLKGRLILQSFYASDFKTLNNDLLGNLLLEDQRKVVSY